jgi:hypothetical protein
LGCREANNQLPAWKGEGEDPDTTHEESKSSYSWQDASKQELKYFIYIMMVDSFWV